MKSYLLFAGIITTASAGMIAGNHWHGASRSTSPASDSAAFLDRRVASAHLHGVAASDAIPALENLIGAKIVARWDAMEKLHVKPDREIFLDFEDVPARELLQAFTEQLRGYTDAADFNPENGVVLIAPNSILKKSLRVYDVADLRSGAPLGAWPKDDIAAALRFSLEARYWNCGVEVHAQQSWLHADSSRLAVVQTAEAHRQIAAVLSGLRQARADGSGPGIARSRNGGRESFRTIVRFYDVRDLIGRAEYTESNSFGNEGYSSETRQITGAQAVAGVVMRNARNGPGQVCPAAGRLMVEQTPAMQEHVRQTLADIRAGKPVEGFRLVSPPAIARDDALTRQQ